MTSPASRSDHIPERPLFLHDPESIGNQLDIVEYWRSITKRKWAILSFAAAVTLLAAVIAFVMTPVYRATTMVLIESSKAKVVSIDEVYGGISQTREYFQTQVEIMKSREVAIKAVVKARLWEHPDFDPRLPRKGLSALLESIGFSTDKPVPEWTDETLADAVVGAMSKNLSIQPIRLSQLVTVSFDSTDRQLAAKVANALAEVYIENDLNARYQMTQKASTWLQEQLAAMKDKLSQSEAALQNYREREGIVEMRGTTPSVDSQQVGQTIQRLIESRARRAESENAYQAIKEATSSGNLGTLPNVIRNPTVAEAKRQEADAQRKLSELAQRYGSEHPKYKQAEAELSSAQDNVRRQIDTVVGSIQREYEAALGTEKAMEASLSKARGSVQNLNRKEFQLGVLEREVESNRQMFEMFVKRAKETNVSGELQSANARVIDPAIVPERPVKPKKLLIVAAALVFGLFVGVLVSLLIDRLDNTLKSTEDAEVHLKHPILTALPLLPKEGRERVVSARHFLDSPESIYSEAIRSARTGVLLSGIDQPKRVLLVTSSVPGEGKTTFSINLALAHAQTRKTLLIDADMRRPATAKGLGLPPGINGLSDLVSGVAEYADCAHSVAGSRLTVIPTGSIPPNPLELLHSHRFSDLLETLQQSFDIIIIDSPPVELVSDALVIASQATGIIYVTKANDTPWPLARKGLQRLRRAGGNILGIALNQFDHEKASRYHGEYSAYGKYGYTANGYGGGYLGGDRPTEDKKVDQAA